MKKILTVFLGGTICCSVDNTEGEGVRDINLDRAKSALINNYIKENPSHKGFGEDVFHISFLEESILSEDMNFGHLISLAKHLNTFDLKEFSGIIILHGTDTLAFSSAFLWEALGNVKVPIFLVSGNLPPTHKLSNANANFCNAVKLIQRGIAPNLYVAYRNGDGVSRLYLGNKILQCENFTDDFRFIGEEYVIDENSLENLLEKSKYFEKNNKEIPLDKLENKGIKILAIKPCTGLDYSVFNLENAGAVVHGTYHSMTVCTKGEQHSLIKFNESLKKNNLPLIVAPCNRKGEKYPSTLKILKETNVVALDGTFESAYAKCYLGILLGYEGADLVNFLEK